MKRSTRLKNLARFQQLREKQKLHALLYAKEKLNKQVKLVEQLSAYIGDYQRINSPDSSHETSVLMLRNASRFVHELDAARDFQTEQVEQVRNNYDKEHADWAAANAEGKAMGRLIEDFERVEERDALLQQDREVEEQWCLSHCKR